MRSTVAGVAVAAILAAGCSSQPGISVARGEDGLRIVHPSQDQILSVRSLSAEVAVTGNRIGRLRYFLDGADQGQGDTTITVTDVVPGKHRLEVLALDAAGHPLAPELRVAVDFTVQ